jgi:hypothetical protein
MTNPVNVEVVVEKQLHYLRTATDVFLRTDLVSRITQAAEKFAPSNSWCVAALSSHYCSAPLVEWTYHQCCSSQPCFNCNGVVR